jgi:hypothetical protein
MRANEKRHIEIVTGGKARRAAASSSNPPSSRAQTERDEIVQKEVFGRVVSEPASKGRRPGHRVGPRVPTYGLASSVWT